MLRKLNFTERLKIPRSCVRIDLRRGADGVLAFDAAVDVRSLPLPDNARMYIEALYRTSYMRFDCGALAAPSMPANRRLDEIDSDRLVRFRVKVVGEAEGARQIIAASNDIIASTDASASGARLSLLPVNFDDLGDEVWRIHFDDGQPVLELNSRISGIERLARNDPEFFALVYPAAVRQVLTHVLLVERWEENDDDDASDAAELWIRWARAMIDDPVPEDADDRRAWIDDVVTAFCGTHRTAGKLRSAISEEPA